MKKVIAATLIGSLSITCSISLLALIVFIAYTFPAIVLTLFLLLIAYKLGSFILEWQ